jgi:hypothetical protein
MTKGPCKFHLLQGACSSPVVLQRACSCPVVYRVTGCGACVPDAMQHGRSVLQPLVSLSRASAAAMMHCRSGTLTDLRRLVGACLKPALPKQNADSAKVPDQRSTTTRRYRPTLSTEVMMIGITIVRLIKGLNNTGDSEFDTRRPS